MSDTTENLERYYKAFAEQQDDYYFFKDLASYVKFIIETPETSVIADKLKGEAIKQRTAVQNGEKEAIAELAILKNNLFAEIKKQKIDDPITLEIIAGYEREESPQTIGSTAYKIDTLRQYFSDLIHHLKINGHKDLVDKFVEERDGDMFFRNINITAKIREFHALKYLYDNLAEIEEWGVWGDLLFVYEVVRNVEETIRKLAYAEPKNWYDLWALELVRIDFEKMKDFSDGTISHFVPTHLKRKKYLNYATAIHNYLIKDLSKKSEALRGLEALNEMQSRAFGMLDAPKPELSEAEKASLRTKSQQRVVEEMVKNAEPVGKKKTKELKPKSKVEKITIIKMKNGKHSVAVNEDYGETREIKDISESWQIFIQEIKDKNIRPESRTNVKDISVSMRDYFDYNEACPIYMGGKYTLTDVIIGRDIRMINPEIKTKIITEKQFSVLKKRKSKELKRT